MVSPPFILARKLKSPLFIWTNLSSEMMCHILYRINTYFHHLQNILTWPYTMWSHSFSFAWCTYLVNRVWYRLLWSTQPKILDGNIKYKKLLPLIGLIYGCQWSLTYLLFLMNWCILPFCSASHFKSSVIQEDRSISYVSVLHAWYVFIHGNCLHKTNCSLKIQVEGNTYAFNNIFQRFIFFRRFCVSFCDSIFFV